MKRKSALHAWSQGGKSFEEESETSMVLTRSNPVLVVELWKCERENEVVS